MMVSKWMDHEQNTKDDLKSIDETPFTQMLEPRISDF